MINRTYLGKITNLERFEKLMDMLHKSDECDIQMIEDYNGGKHALVRNARTQKVWSIICHLYSYGGTDGLLEIAQVKYPDRIMDPVGWLCERDAYERITR